MGFNPIYLGIDTSCGWTSFGLVDSQGVVASQILRARESRSQGFVARLRSFLDGCGVGLESLAALGVVVGPGSFTALRVGVSSAQGLAMGLGIPLVPVETHEAAIRSVPFTASPTLIIVPARKGEVFAQAFVHNPGIGWVSEDVIECLKVEGLPKVLENPAFIAGPGLAFYREEVAAIYGDRIPLAPEASWTLRGEQVALFARDRQIGESTDFDPGATEIRYLQSHGALTIAERGKSNRKS